MGLRPNILAGLLGGVIATGDGSGAMADLSIADNIAPGTFIAYTNPPAGYTTTTLYDDNGGRWVIGAGQALYAGTTAIEPGTHIPVIKHKKPGSRGRTGIHLSPLITVTVTRTGADFAPILAANFPEDAVLSGSDVTSIPGRWGSSVTLTGAFTATGLPQILTGVGPNSKNLIKISDNNSTDKQKFTFSAQNAPIQSHFLLVSMSQLSAGQTFINDGTAANNINVPTLGTNGCINVIGIRVTGMAAVQNLTLNTAARIQTSLKSLVILELDINGTGQSASVYVNGVLGGTVTLTGATGQNWSALFNIGGNSILGTIFGGYFSIPRIPTATERSQILAMLSQYRSREFLFDAVGGNDSNFGWTSGSPKQDIAAFMNAQLGVYPGDRYLSKGGVVVAPSASITVPTATGTGGNGSATNPVYFGSWDPATGHMGKASRANFCLSTTIPKNTAAWTDAGGGTWIATLPISNPVALWVRGVDTKGIVRAGNEPLSGAPYSHTVQKDAVANGTWRFASIGTAGTLRLDDTLSPNNYDIIVPKGIVSLMSQSRDYWTYLDYDQNGAGDVLTQFGGGINTKIHRLRSYEAINDAYNFNGVGPILGTELFAYNLGALPRAYSDTASTGDPFTAHGTTNYKISGGVAAYCNVDGCVDQQYVTANFEDTLFHECAKGWVREQNGGASSQTAALLAIDFCELVRPLVTTDGSFTFDDAVKAGSGLSACDSTTIIRVGNSILDGSLGSVRGYVFNNVGGAGGATFVDDGNNSFIGFTAFKNF